MLIVNTPRTKTTRLELVKPQPNESYNIADFNDNYDLIDNVAKTDLAATSGNLASFDADKNLADAGEALSALAHKVTAASPAGYIATLTQSGDIQKGSDTIASLLATFNNAISALKSNLNRYSFTTPVISITNFDHEVDIAVSATGYTLTWFGNSRPQVNPQTVTMDMNWNTRTNANYVVVPIISCSSADDADGEYTNYYDSITDYGTRRKTICNYLIEKTNSGFKYRLISPESDKHPNISVKFTIVGGIGFTN